MKHFVNPTDSYRRRIDLIPTYVGDSALYLALQTGRPVEECRAFVEKEIGPAGGHPLHFPSTMALVKNRHGDREIREMPFNHYLDGVFAEGQILSPTMAAYTHPDVEESILAKYISGNLQKRKKAKHQKFVAKMSGDKALASIKEGEQTSLKIKNNSLSGAHSSPFTILWNKSSHSTLTSTCRTATSYGNANNEKFLYGNRHYWSPDIVKNNIVSIVRHTDYDKLAAVIEKYQLALPSYEIVMASIHRSTDLYWRSPKQMAVIESLVRALSPMQRAAFLYTGDFYQLAQLNPQFVRGFLEEMSTKATQPEEIPDHWVDRMDSNLKAFVSILCAKELAGESIDDTKKSRPHDYAMFAATTRRIIEAHDKYEDLIRTLWVTDNVPSSIFNLPSVIRRGAITSDTDSTIFTVQYWTEWYVGKLDFTETSVAIANTMVYLAAQLIRHILATFSGNMGVARKDVTRLAMKNEYYFPIFTLTSRAKHYFAYIAAQEGNVYKEYDTEIKGVALRNSNVPPEIMKQAKQFMLDCMDTVIAGKKISVVATMRHVAAIENGIRAGVEAGRYNHLTKGQIKNMESYKNPQSSNFLYYQMWEEVFAEKYGHAPEPPYVAIKVSIDADNPTKLKNWIARMEDRSVADKMTDWITRNSRNGVTQMLLPEQVLAMTGVPKEAVCGIDIRGLISQTMEAFYLVLESLGIFMRNDNITRLVSDQYPLEKPVAVL
jgi:hypothetical protein